MLKFVEENGHIVGAVQVIDDEGGEVDNGMTIDKAIAWLNTDDFESKGFADATSIAISIMRKYQKIEQIINNAKDSDGAVKYNWLYEQIRKVVEDATN